MKSKKSLLSVLLAALLLATCVAGMLIFSASAATTKIWYVSSTDGSDSAPVKESDSLVFRTLEGALNYAKSSENWGENDTLTIVVRDSSITYDKSVSGSTLFGCGRIEKANHEGLPITIQPAGTTKLELYLENGKDVTAIGALDVVNEFTFSNITFTGPQYLTYGLYVSAARVEFHNCEFPIDKPTTAYDKSVTAFINANGYTFASYGLTADNLATRKTDGKIQSEIVFSGTTKTILASTKPVSSNRTYGVYVYAQGAISSTTDFPSSSTVGGEKVSRSSFAGKVTVKGNANISTVYGTNSKYLLDSEVSIESGTVANVYGVSGNNITRPGNSKAVINISGGHVSGSLYGIYSGSTNGVTLDKGASVEINISGVTSGKTHCSSSSSATDVILVQSKYPWMTVKEGASITLTVSGENTKVTDIYASLGISPGSKSNPPHIRIGGELNINLNGGTVGNVYGMRDGVSTEKTYAVENEIQSTGSINVNVNGATVNDVTMVSSNGSGTGNVIFGGSASFTMGSGSVSRVVGVGSGPVATKAGAQLLLSLNGGTVGSVYGLREERSSTKTYTIENEVEETAEIQVNVNGATVTDVSLLSSDGVGTGSVTFSGSASFTMNSGSVSRVVGVGSGPVATKAGAQLLLSLNGGTVGSVYGLREERSSTETYTIANEVEETAEIQVNVNGATVTDVSLLSSDGVGTGSVTFSGSASFTMNSGSVSRVVGIGTGNVTANAKACLNLTLNGGTVSKSMYLVDAASGGTINSGAVIAAYLNGGSYSVNYARLLYNKVTVDSKDVAGSFPQFQSGSKVHIELNGATVPSSVYSLNYVDFAADIEYVITSLDTGIFRPLSYVNTTGNVIVTVDTTEDGFTGLENDSNVNAEEKKVKIDTFHPGWSSSVYGTGTVQMNGGADKSTIDIINFYGVSAKNIVNRIQSATIGTFYAARGGLTNHAEEGVSSIENVIKDCEIKTSFSGAGNAHNILYGNGSVSNTIENTTITTFYPLGFKMKDVFKDCVVTNLLKGSKTEITELYPASLLTGSGNVTFFTTIEGGTYHSGFEIGNGIISGGVFEGLVDGENVALNGDITLRGGGRILADSVGKSVVITKEGDWDSFDTVYVSVPADAEGLISIIENDAERDPLYHLNEGKYEVRGWYPTVYATIMLEDRIYMKIFVNDAVADAFAKVAGDFDLVVRYNNLDKNLTLEDLKGEGYLLAAEGAGEFDHSLTYSLNGEQLLYTTIQEIAENGASYYAEEPQIANLFSAIASYGKAALNTSFDFDVNDLLAIQRYGNNEANIDPEQFSVSRESQTIDFDSIHLLMGDTVGLRLKVSDATQGALQGAKLYLVDADGNRKALATDRYIKNEDSLDIFIHAKDYETFAHLIVTDENGVVCLDLNASVSYLMYEMVKGNVTTPTNPKETTLKDIQLQATALFIVRTNEYLDYLAEQNYKYPEVPKMDKNVSYVGYARRDITPSYAVTIYEGKGYTARDAMMITCTAVSDGENIALIMSADLKGIEQGVADAAIQQIENEYGIPRERIIISATHTHSAPTIDTSSGQAKWRSYFYSQTLKAVGEALSDLAPVEKALAGKGYTENVNFVRRFLLQSGNYQTNASTTQADKPTAHESEADNEVRVIRFVREGKKDVLIMNYQTHYGLYKQTYSADFIHLLRKWAEQDEDLHFAYYSGASGNLNMTPKFTGENEHNKVSDFSKGDTDYGRVEKMWKVAKAALDVATEIEMGKVVGATRLYLAEIGYESDELVAAATALYDFGSGSDEETISAKSAKLAELLEKFEGTDADKAILQQNGMSYRWAQGVERRARLRAEWEKGYQPIPFTAIAFGEIAFTSSPIEQFDANAKWVRENSPFYSASSYPANTTSPIVELTPAEIAEQNDAYKVSNFNSDGELKGDLSTTDNANSFVETVDLNQDGKSDRYENGMTFTMSLANGSCGYVPTAFAFPHGTYEVLVCRYVAGSGEEFALAQLDLLNRCYNAQH